MNIALTKKELAEIAGYSPRQLYNINRDLPKDKKLFVASEGGKYDLAFFVQRWVEYNITKGIDEDLDLDTVKAEHEKVKLQKTELEVQRLRGELIAVHDVRRAWGDVINAAMQNLLRLPNSIAPLVLMMNSTERVAGIIDTELRRILENIADTPLPDYALQEDENDEDED